MAVSEQSKEYQHEEEEDYNESGGSDPGFDSDDSDQDPSYSILEDTHAKLSNLSIKKNQKKSKARIGDDMDMGSEGDPDEVEVEVVVPELDEKDAESFLKVQKIIEAGQVEKLKVDQCKVYLRKNGLRLTGNKDTLIQRIKEHQEILNGVGEKKYPVSSFVLNCKGDACTGDVVMFEQNVYEMFNIASRSASGPPCGTRIVAGRIVKESYGAAKQQHTFTIEVLWSKGEKPLPPLHPLLIKGRNLYRLKTLRQRWESEGERQKTLMEKHSRGSLARSDREVRIQQKEKGKMLKATRILRKEDPKKNRSQFNLTSAAKSAIQPQQSGLSINSEKQAFQPPELRPNVNSGAPAIPQQQFDLSVDPGQLAMRAEQLGLFNNSARPVIEALQSSLSFESRKVPIQPHQTSQNFVESRYSSNADRINSGRQEVQHLKKDNEFHTNYNRSNFCPKDHLAPVNRYPNINGTRGLAERTYHRQPFTSMNNFPPMSPPRKQLCRYYPQGRCHFGDNCKFLHELKREYGQRREEMWPCDQRNSARW